MSTPRFLADHNFNDNIIQGVQRREPGVEFVTLRELGGQRWDDAQVLEFAAANGWSVLSHDTRTMPAPARQRLANDQIMRGLFLVHQDAPIRPVMDDLILIWAASEAEEWLGLIEFLPF